MPRVKDGETKKYKQLDFYFENLALDNKKIPFISKVSEETKISAATVSRYARSKGYFNYPEMRARLATNQRVFSKNEYRVEKFISFLKGNKRFSIVTSMSAEVIGHFLLARLHSMKFDVVLNDKNPKANEGRAIIIVTISGESIQVDSFIKSQKTNDMLLITCMQTVNARTISLSEYMYNFRSTTELFRSLRNVNDWIQKAIDAYVAMMSGEVSKSN